MIQIDRSNAKEKEREHKRGCWDESEEEREVESDVLNLGEILETLDVNGASKY